MKETLVSIIIPVYNVEAYLDPCIRSVVGQTYPYIEILLVDDASTDRGGAICEEWADKDPRIQVIHQAHAGLSQARNTGLERATGEWIVYVDSDDTVHPELVETCLETAKEYRADVVVFDYRRVDETGAPIPEQEPGKNIRRKKSEKSRLRDREPEPEVTLYTGEELLAEYIKQGTGGTAVWNKLYRRSIWKTLRFPVGRLFEDMYVITDIWKQAGRVAYRKKVLYDYRKRTGSITDFVMVEERYDILEALRRRCIRLSDREELYPILLAAYFHYVVDLYHVEKARPKRKKMFRQFQKIWKRKEQELLEKGRLEKGLWIQIRFFSVWPEGFFTALKIYGACCSRFPVLSKVYHKLIGG